MTKMPWQSAPLPSDETQRLYALDRYEIVDTVPEKEFDRLTEIAAHHFDMPIALVSLIDKQRQWFKSHFGIEATETPREIAFCAHVLIHDGPMIVRNAAVDARFAGNPLVAGPPDIRFYAGAPLISRAGYKLGTLCIIDRIPHYDFTEGQARELEEIAAIVVDELELRLRVRNDRREHGTEISDAPHGLQPPVNLSRLDLIADTDQDKAAILALFFSSSAPLLETMKNSLHGGEAFVRWRNAAHSLRGSAANLGMQNLEALCRQCEQAADALVGQYTALYNSVSAEIEAIRTYLRSHHPLLIQNKVSD